MSDEIILPKGKVLHLLGCPVELKEDTAVFSPTIAHYGSLEAFEREWATNQCKSRDDEIDVQTTPAPMH
jgi:hypothetical protein